MTKKIAGFCFIDDRGILKGVNDFSPIDCKIKRFYQVENHEKGFIRAWHGHKKEEKYVYVVKGSVLFGIVDMKTQEIEKHILSDKRPEILCIPARKYNGFKTLEENTILIFFSTTDMNEVKDDDFREDYDKWNIWNITYR